VLAPQKPISEKIEMNFHEFEARIRKREESGGVGDISTIIDRAEEVDLDDLLHMLTHEILFSTQPKILPLDKESKKMRIAILQRPGLRGKYYVEMTGHEVWLFRAGYDDPLVTYAGDIAIREVYDLMKKEFKI